MPTSSEPACPTCGTPFGPPVAIGPGEEPRPPQVGDGAICTGCGDLAVVGADGRWRPLTADEAVVAGEDVAVIAVRRVLAQTRAPEN